MMRFPWVVRRPLYTKEKNHLPRLDCQYADVRFLVGGAYALTIGIINGLSRGQRKARSGLTRASPPEQPSPQVASTTLLARA